MKTTWISEKINRGLAVLVILVLILSFFPVQAQEVKYRNPGEIIQDIKDFEESHKLEPVSVENLQYLGERVKELYLAKFGGPLQEVDFVFLSHQEFRNKFEPLGVRKKVVAIACPAYIEMETERKIFKKENKIYVDREFPDINWQAKNQNHLSIFRILMAHEIVHSQAILLDPPAGILSTKDLTRAYHWGFKIVAFPINKRPLLPVFQEVDEAVIQFLANELNDPIDGNQTVYLAIGQVISEEVAKGAEFLAKLFRKLEINPLEVAQLHRASKVMDFLNLLTVKANLRFGDSLVQKLGKKDFGKVVFQGIQGRKFKILDELIDPLN